jgi:hypothetical protein
MDDMSKQLEILGPRRAAGSSVLLLGDFNTAIAQSGIVTRRPWTTAVRMIGITRVVPTQQLSTNKKETEHGTAIGIMATADLHEQVKSTLHTIPATEFNLSDHHVPLLCELLVTVQPSPPAKRARVAQATPQPTLEGALAHSNSFADIQIALEQHTAPPEIVLQPLRGHRLKQFFQQAYAKHGKSLMRAQYTNPRKALHLVMYGKPSPDEVPLPPETNGLWATVLEERWKSSPLNIEELTRICSCIPPMTAEALALLHAPITIAELLQAEAKWGSRKVFSDYTVSCLKLLNIEAR